MFVLPADSCEKISLGILKKILSFLNFDNFNLFMNKGTTILLAFFVNSVVLDSYIPNSSSTLPMIGVFYFTNIIYTAFSIAISVLILNIHCKAKKKTAPAPKWLKKILFIRDTNIGSLNMYDYLSESDSSQDSISTKLIDSDKTINEVKNELKFSSLRKDPQLLSKISNRFQKLIRDLEVCQSNLELEDQLNDEWKKVAARVDHLFVILSLITLILTPTILIFMKLKFDYEQASNAKSCGCSNGFSS
jgi:hypothetical protein